MPRGKSRPARWAEEAQRLKLLHRLRRLSLSRPRSRRDASLPRPPLEYEEMRDNVPENLQSSPYYEKLDAVASLDFSSEEVEEMISAIDEAEQVELPLGFGRD